MRIIARLIGFILLTIVFGFFTVGSSFAANYQLQGSVKDNSAVAISGATVDVFNPGTTTDVVSPTTTDGSGNYVFSSVPVGTYDIKVTPSGSGFSSAIALSQNVSNNTTLNFVLVPIGSITISGTLFDSQGSPLANQPVSLKLAGNNTVASATTNSSGNYSFQVAPNTYQLVLGSSGVTGNVPSTYYLVLPLTAYSQNTNQIINMPTKRVIVHVQDVSGNAISNVGLSTTSNLVSQSNLSVGGGVIASGQNGYTNSNLKTDTSGNATMWLYSGANPYTITATPPNGSSLVQTSVSNNIISSDTSITITLQQAITVSGTLFDSQGSPLANQPVSLKLAGNNTVASATTNSSGNYSFQVAPNTYQLVLGSSGVTGNVPSTYYLVLPLTAYSQNTNQIINMPTKRVIVHVQDVSGNAISNVGLSTTSNLVSQSNLSVGGGVIASGQNGYTNSNLKTDTSGNATMWLYSGANPYTITATPPNGSSYSQASLNNNVISTDINLTITLQKPITISGTLFDSQGSPLANQPVSLKLAGNNTVASATTDSSGNYSFQVTSNIYQLVLTVLIGNINSHTATTYGLVLPLTPYSQNTVQNIIFPAKKVTIHVQDALGNPVNNVGLSTGSNLVNQVSLQVGNGVIASGQNGYTNNNLLTDASGSATMWLYPGTNPYNIIATPSSGSIYSTFTLNSISVSGDQTELISLQYNHAIPTTTATFSPSPINGTYTDPVTVTLSATAAAGYNLNAPGGTYYKIDGGTQQAYSVPFTVSGAGSHTITYWSVDNSGVQELPNSQAFTIVIPTPTPTPIPTYSLSGIVYNDANQNGAQGDGEIGYSGATVMLDSGQSVTTDTNGNYSFSNLTTGTYEETLTIPTGYEATTANPVSVALSTNTTQNFGIAVVPTPTPTNTPTPTPTVTPTPVLVLGINTGGDTQGNFVADEDYSGGQSYTSSTAVDTSNVANPAPQSVYQTVRYGNFSYTIPNLTPNADYTVKLHFNELYWNSAESRVFNVSINGQQALTNFDIYQAAGGTNKAIVEQFPTTADTNGNVTIQFTTVTDNAMVNGIEVYSGTLPSPTPTPTPVPVSSIAVNAGGNSSSSFLSDQDFNGGQTYTSSDPVDTSGVLNPAPQSVYQSVRFGNFSYTIPNLFPNTNYLVKLDFNELYQNSVGSRVFNVLINGQQVLTNFDIYKSAGGKNKAIARQFLATSDATGKISLVFSTVVDNAMINGIELSQANSIQTYSLTGTVYTDINQNGVQAGGTGYKGAIVTLDNGQSATTDINGNYSFTNLPTDIYTETLTLPTGYIATTTNPVSVTLDANTTQNFGVAQGNIDISAGGTGSGSFLSDQDFSGGQTYITTNTVDTSAVINPAPESVYQSVRFGNFSYTIPNLTPNSTYTVRLHFNELYWNSAGSRVFNVSINGQQVLTNFDIYQAAGGANKAVAEEFPATVDANGNITINFATVTDNAMVNGIELVH
jgi:protocatechuate 3,4-dioxygenase beta subunit